MALKTRIDQMVERQRVNQRIVAINLVNDFRRYISDEMFIDKMKTATTISVSADGSGNAYVFDALFNAEEIAQIEKIKKVERILLSDFGNRETKLFFVSNTFPDEITEQNYMNFLKKFKIDTVHGE